ncbi:S8 family serine peptidase [Marinobacter sediminum]|uniref:S8 family serine peptidase n=1 Tax=Marinobacter sediminum TaxID=256323 RepID=UPI00202FDBC2|nr:S8 family serine peptidase [Marinobacter sediminum]MCM0613789.1 S8 family serine peptidase [Marinobacter sediminum]
MRAHIIKGYRTGIFMVFMASASPLQALGTGSLVQPSLNSINRHVESAAERAVDRAMERRASQRLETTEENLQATLAELPERVSIPAADGSEAFADVRVEDGWRAVERQWLVTVDPGELQYFRQNAITILEQTRLSGLGLTVLRFRVSEAVDSRKALTEILPEHLIERLDRNHIYSPQASAAADGHPDPVAGRSGCQIPIKMGMVDTAINSKHPDFSGASIVQNHFLDDLNLKEGFQKPDSHGTAVASLLVGKLSGQGDAGLPNATLLNASVFFGREDLSSGATLMHLVRGLNWLVSQQVRLINISMAGPDNRLLATAIRQVSEAGIAMVAAVGNQGPAAPPLYPAAYPGVVGVTAVGPNNRVYRWANHGEQVDFAARGVDVRVAASGGGYERKSGTSMATPLITTRLACEAARSADPLPDLVRRLADQVQDLGKAGRDPVFGYGVLVAP